MCSWPKAQLRLSTLPGRRTSQTHDPRSPLDRERLSLTSQRFLSPLDTDPNRLPPQEPVLSCGDPWAAARARLCGGAHPGPTPHGKAQSAATTSRRMRFSVTLPPGRRGTQPPASLRGTMKSGPTGQMRPGNPPARLRGGFRQGPQASAWGLIARKGAVWAEGLADGAPWAKPRHHQAVSCGLRRCRELRLSCNKMRTRHQDIIHQEDKLAIIGIVHRSLADLLGSPALPWVDDVQKPKCVHHRRRPSATRTLRRRHGGPTSSPCIASPRSIRQGRPRYPSRFSQPLRHCRCRRHAARSPPRSWG